VAARRAISHRYRSPLCGIPLTVPACESRGILRAVPDVGDGPRPDACSIDAAESGAGAAPADILKGKTIMGSIHDLFRSHGLIRPSEGRILGGVCAGLGRRIGLDPWPARLLFVLILLVLPGCQLLLYPILWITMPKAEPGEVSATPVEFGPPA
jgi:phage shock protein PspC (stress-responsive transcriptional regulator)